MSSTVNQTELDIIIPADRSYVAAEMNAFLIYWLSVLDCPMLNRPTARSLGGPGWYPEHWIRCAARIGLRVAPIARSVTAAGYDEPAWNGHDGPAVALTLVGEQCIGDAAIGLKQKARRLAAAAGVGFVCFRFDSADTDARFLSADPFPSLEDGNVAQAVLSYLTAR